MALPSGTSISADDINSHLGRSSGSAVSWNTMVRTLSNNNSSPNLNDARGVGPRHVTYAINQTTGNSGTVSSLYYNDWLYNLINVHSIPNSPWRVVLNSTKDNSGYNYIEMRVIGTGSSYGTVYRYVIGGSSPLYPGGGPGGTNACLTTIYRSAMLSNGKLVIVHAMATTTNSSFGGSAIGMITLTFNTDGSCAGLRYYNTTLNSTIDTSGNVFFNDIYDHSSFTLSTSGNSFAFAFHHNNYNPAYHQVVKVDASTDTLSIKYAIIAGSSNTTYATGVSSGYEYTCKAILQSNGDVTVIRTPASNDSSIPVMVNKLADGGGWSTYSNTRWSYVNSKYYLPYSGGANFYITDASLGDNRWRSIYIDKLNYYYIVQFQARYWSQQQVASQWYFTGSTGTVTIQKIRSSDNANICKIGLTADGYAWGSYTYDGKNGYSYNQYPYHVLGRSSVMSIESDSSGNTYIVYKAYYTGNGGSQSSPNPTDLYTLSPPVNAQMVFHLSKFDSSGNHVWSKILDVGPKQAQLMPYAYGVIGDDVGVSNTPESIAILLREEINIAEIYVSAFVRNSSVTTHYDINSNIRSFRSLHINMSTGDTLTWSDGNNSILNVENNFTSRTGYTVKSSSGNLQNMTLVPIQKFTISTNNAVTDSNVFSTAGSWTTVTASAYATGNPSLNAVPSLGSTYGSYTV